MDQKRVKDLLEYRPETGVFTWRMRKHGVTVGRIAGNIGRYGYWYMVLDGKRYAAHRLVWLYVYGEWPAECIDHINRVRTDNRLVNIRAVTRAQNRQNLGLDSKNKSGFRGVSYDAKNKKWRASISIQGKAKNLGRYENKNLAVMAYKAAAAKYHTHNMSHV